MESNNSQGRIYQTFGRVIAVLFCVINIHAMQYDNLVSGSINYSNYNSNTINQHPQNWGITQSAAGILYFANQGGVVEYDGVSWNRINLPAIAARSIDIDNHGKIFVGSYGDFGYLYPDSTGSLKYNTLINKLKNTYHDFTNVFYTFCTKECVVFNAIKYLFIWDGVRVKVIPSKSNFHCAFRIDNTFYVKENGIGIKKLSGDSLVFVEGSGIFADMKIYSMFRTKDGEILIGTRSNGFYIYDGNNFTSFKTKADEYIAEKLLSHGIQISNGDYAFTTLRGGIVIIAPNGEVRNIFTTTDGLQDNDVKYIYEDRSGNLWLALNDGITKIEKASPFSFYTQKNGLEGIIVSTVRYGKDFYAGSTSGLYHNVFDESRGNFKNLFQKVPGIESVCWDMLVVNEKLILGITTEPNVKLLPPGILTVNQCYSLIQSKHNPARIFAAKSDGLRSYILENSLKEEYNFPQISQEIRSLGEDNRGNLWLGTISKGVIKIVNPREEFNADSKLKIVYYDTSDGLSDGEINILSLSGKILFGTDKGLYSLNESMNRFLPDSMLGAEFANGSRNVFNLVEDDKKNIWFHSQSKNYLASPLGNDRYEIIYKPFERIYNTQVNVIFPDENYVWFGTKNSLIRYDRNDDKNYEIKFSTLIRSIKLNGDSLIFGGSDLQLPGSASYPEIEYQNRNIRFEYAAAFYEDESRNEYQYRLDGYDDEWSNWTTETIKDYTNLSEGKYIFYVRAKNIYGTIGSEDSFTFYVLPPFYRTWIAYVTYLILLVCFIFILFRWRLKKLEKEKKELETIVEQRTEEVRNQNVKLKEQSEQLLEMDKIKSRFFANISHEFRTPLTLIIGPLEQWIEKKSDESDKNKISMMLRNAKRLLGLINELLDLSKMESGQMKMEIYKLNPYLFLKGIAGTFISLAEELRINYEIEIPQRSVDFYCDPRKIEKVVINILSNAFKFTKPEGTIKIEVNDVAENSSDTYPDGYLRINVSDNGIGIKEDKISKIFDRFYQAEKSSGEHFEGTGIGLALSKEFVELHSGDIYAESNEGKGTMFIVHLPLGKNHFKSDEEIIDYTDYLKTTVGYEPVKHPGKGNLGFDSVESGSEIAGKKTVVHLIEDNADVRSYLKEYLSPEYEVIESENGDDGIKTARSRIPDLIISDIMMPGKDGFELCDILKNDLKTSHIPIILLTAKASEKNIIRGYETKADDYITKPFSMSILLSRIKNLLDLRAQLHQRFQREMLLQPSEVNVSSLDEEFIKQLHSLFEKNLSDAEWGIDELCQAFFMSRAAFFRKVNAITGMPPIQYLQSYRLKRAAQLLKSKAGNVTEIAFRVGFNNSAYFTKCFKKAFNQLPSDYHSVEA